MNRAITLLVMDYPAQTAKVRITEHAGNVVHVSYATLPFSDIRNERDIDFRKLYDFVPARRA